MTKKAEIQEVVMGRRKTREGYWGPWHIMKDWQSGLCGKDASGEYRRVTRLSHCSWGKVCHTCMAARKNHLDKIHTMVMQWNKVESEKRHPKGKEHDVEAVCILCRPETRKVLVDENEIPYSEKGWRIVGYTDGDHYAYCPDHSPEQVLQDILNRCDHEIGLYCGIERVYGFGERRRCAHLDLYFVALDDQDTLAMSLPMSLEGANKWRESKLKEYPGARIVPCTAVCNFCEYGYPK